MNAIEWLKHSVTVFGLSAPVWMLLVLALGPVIEWALGRFAPTKCASLIAVIATGLKLVLQVTRIGAIPIVGTGIVRVLESIAGVDLDGDGHVGDPPAGSGGVVRLVLVVFLGLSLGVSGCAAVVSQLPVIIAYVQDAEIVLHTIQSVMDAIWATHPDPKNQVLVDGAIAKCLTAADAVNRAAQGGQDVNQGQIDAAFAEFEGAFNDLMSLVGRYGVQAGDVPKAVRTANGGVIVPRPLLLSKARR
jgi:hypothetical protein